MKLTAQLVESLSGVYLSPRYDQPRPTPDFHRECWRRYCSDALAAATAAPRNHAKSTALTHDFCLAEVLFRDENYVIIVSSSEEMAAEHLGDITTELTENDDLIRDFKIKEFLKRTGTDVIVECTDGYQFRILARGAEQKIRGRKWRGKRPGLIIVDDLEDDEQVENRDRRKKLRKWFFRACKQALRDSGKIRVHGTILHKDALLNHLMHNVAWSSRCYKASRGYSDFSGLLWPEKFSESRLRAIRQEFIEEGDSAGYSQEYLNDPRDDENAYLLLEQFLPLREEDLDQYRLLAVGCDFAVSKKDAANRTSFTIGGKTIDNFIDVMDQRVGRWDSKEWVDVIFEIEERWHPAHWFVEDGVIWKAVYPIIRDEMRERNIFLDFVPTLPVKDKATRGQPFRKRMKAGGCRFNKRTSWYDEYEEELLDFSATAEATLDDQFDSTVTLERGLDDVILEDGDERTAEEEAFEAEAMMLKSGGDGRCPVTGY
jgi:predicted phage terminase large subunit-like protein